MKAAFITDENIFIFSSISSLEVVVRVLIDAVQGNKTRAIS
jgi:hypothetical protein